MKKLWLILVILMALAVSGCEQMISLVPTKETQAAEPLPQLEKVQDLNLARLLLKTEKSEYTIARDPFQPLFLEPQKEVEERVEVIRQVDFEFLGVVKMDLESMVLLKCNDDKGVYRINDIVKGYEVIDIQENEVTLKKGSKKINLQRGGIN